MDKEGFTSVIIPLGRKLFRYACSFLKDREEAEDAVQEVMIKLWNLRDSLEQYRSPEAFAMTVTRNHCLDRLRRRKTLRWEEVSTQVERSVRGNAPDLLMERTDHVEKVQQIMEGLSDQQREIVRLRDMEGYEFEEIAELTGITVNMVRVSLSRARKKIRETLIKWNEYGLEVHRDTAGKILPG